MQGQLWKIGNLCLFGLGGRGVGAGKEIPEVERDYLYSESFMSFARNGPELAHRPRANPRNTCTEKSFPGHESFKGLQDALSAAS